MEKQTITIYDVAREANVSMATVSRVVNGNPNVKPATRKKVLEVIDRLDYRPNAVARGLASKKTTTVGVIIPDVSNAFFASLARGIDDVATMYKYNIILANSDGDDQKEVTVLNNLLAKQVDGIIFMGHRITDDIRGEFSRSKTPVVLAGSIDPDEQVGSVNIDYTEATKDATATLAKNGNKKIAFVSGALIDPINGQNRMKGYKEALAENNQELGREVGENVGDRVLKEMNYLMREQDEQEEERFRKLDEAIRELHGKKIKGAKKKEPRRLFAKKEVTT